MGKIPVFCQSFKVDHIKSCVAVHHTFIVGVLHVHTRCYFDVAQEDIMMQAHNMAWQSACLILSQHDIELEDK